MNDEPNYSQYSLDQLEDARRHIDKDAFPERARQIDEEIERREPVPEVHETPREAEFGPEFKRLLAFLFDFGLLAILWALVDNLLFVPVPRSLIIVLSLVLFLGYFSVLETFGSPAASLGKRAVGLHVDATGGMSLAQGVGRSVIVAGVVWFDWYGFMSLAPLNRLPYVFVVLVLGLQFAALLYNAAMFLWISPSGRMIQDLATRTRVHAPEDDSAPTLERWPRWQTNVAITLALLVGVGGVATFTVGTVGVLGRDFSAVLGTPIRDATKVDGSITATIASETSIRTRATVRMVQTWSTAEPSQRKLEVEIWIPATRWTEPVRDAVAHSVVRTLKVEPGYYDGGALVLTTGARFLGMNKSYSLNLP